MTKQHNYDSNNPPMTVQSFIDHPANTPYPASITSRQIEVLGNIYSERKTAFSIPESREAGKFVVPDDMNVVARQERALTLVLTQLKPRLR
jgi:hypothetical protein